MHRVVEFNPECFEQPVPKWNYEGMRHVREHSCGVRIMADESISSLHDVMNVIKNGCADFFNIKVGKVGGLYRACQVAAAVEAAGFQAAAGSNLEPAVCLPSDAFCGTGLHAENLIKTPLAMTPQGTFSCNNASGLGVEVDENIFEK